MKNNEGDRGFIEKILLIIVALLFVKYYFDIDILKWANSPEGQNFLAPVISFLKNLYIWADNVVRNMVD